MQGAGKVAAVAVELLESSQVQAVGLLEWSEPLLSGRLASWLVAWMVALPGAVQAGWPADAGSLVVLLFPVQVPLLVAALVAVQVAVLVPAPDAVLGAVQVAVPVAALVAVPAAVTEVAMVAWTVVMAIRRSICMPHKSRAPAPRPCRPLVQRRPVPRNSLPHSRASSTTTPAYLLGLRLQLLELLGPPQALRHNCRSCPHPLLPSRAGTSRSTTPSMLCPCP